MMDNDFIVDLYRNIDSHNSRAVANTMTDNGVFKFANMPPVEGKENIFNFLEGFFRSIKGISHSDLESWHVAGHWFVNGTVTYTRHNGTLLAVPFSVTLKMDAGKIREYLIFVDNHELYS